MQVALSFDAGARLNVSTWAEGWVDRPARESARSGPTPGQYALAAAATLFIALAVKLAPFGAAEALHLGFLTVFAGGALWRIVLVEAGLRRARPEPRALTDGELPPYTVIAALYRETDMVRGLLASLGSLDYPRERLQVLLALEPDDPDTNAAARAAAAGSPLNVEIVLSPLSGPRTKPKACNAALALATGRLVTVYDAEDRPGRGQLREAASRFADASGRLGCLQAPLRIRPGRGWIQRQFALEYSALFDAALPGYAALGLPFPLGGTSNHFNVDALRESGGWDSWNVTEDADMGFRLAALGWRLDVLETPTWEPAPPNLAVWTPQRTRWVKGYMQTWGVHMRAPGEGGWRRAASLQLSLGLPILSSVLHGALATGVVACLVIGLADLRGPHMGAADVALLVGGWASAVAAMAEGQRARGGRMTLMDAVSAPLYWPLQSLAALFAVWQLFVRPFHWNKTPHEPEPEVEPDMEGVAA